MSWQSPPSVRWLRHFGVWSSDCTATVCPGVALKFKLAVYFGVRLSGITRLNGSDSGSGQRLAAFGCQAGVLTFRIAVLPMKWEIATGSIGRTADFPVFRVTQIRVLLRWR
jgi:hypothetical protein